MLPETVSIRFWLTPGKIAARRYCVAYSWAETLFHNPDLCPYTPAQLPKSQLAQRRQFRDPAGHSMCPGSPGGMVSAVTMYRSLWLTVVGSEYEVDRSQPSAW